MKGEREETVELWTRTDKGTCKGLRNRECCGLWHRGPGAPKWQVNAFALAAQVLKISSQPRDSHCEMKAGGLRDAACLRVSLPCTVAWKAQEGAVRGNRENKEARRTLGIQELGRLMRERGLGFSGSSQDADQTASPCSVGRGLSLACYTLLLHLTHVAVTIPIFQLGILSHREAVICAMGQAGRKPGRREDGRS